jgi:membrane-associated phospholipid phosphatase
MQTVDEGGALKDIFPSLHTAAPLFIALFSFRHRALIPFRYTWPLVLFFSLNIIIATMFLRWHWIIDVVAGVAVATSAQALSVLTTNFELRRRNAEPELGTTWPEFAPANSHTS